LFDVSFSSFAQRLRLRLRDLQALLNPQIEARAA
jgi:hypothetical protein